MKILESDRLILRSWNPETEAELAFEIYGDPEVMRFIGNGQTVADISTLRERLRLRNQRHREAQDGSGYWAIEEKATNTPIGTVILQRLPDGTGELTPDWEVGWHLRRSVWGRGYATEAARVLLGYGFTELQLPVIYAVAHPENQASIRVMERLGMSPKGRTQQYYGVETVLYEIWRSS